MKSKISISTMIGKLKGINAICTNTLTNPFCQTMQKSDGICKFCYSQRMLLGVRRNCAPAWERNSKLLSESVIPYDEIPVLKKDKIFRLQAHGELVNFIHAFNLLLLVIKNPQTTFSWFTKRNDLMEKLFESSSKPDNLIMVRSNSKIDDPDPASKLLPLYDRIFSVYTSKGVEDLGVIINCGGKNCLGCQICYDTTKDVKIVNEHIK